MKVVRNVSSKRGIKDTLAPKEYPEGVIPFLRRKLRRKNATLTDKDLSFVDGENTRENAQKLFNHMQGKTCDIFVHPDRFEFLWPDGIVLVGVTFNEIFPTIDGGTSIDLSWKEERPIRSGILLYLFGP